MKRILALIVLMPTAWATQVSLNNCGYGSVYAGNPQPREYFEEMLLGEPDGDTLRLCGAYCYATALVEFDNGVYDEGVTVRVRHEDWRREPQTFSVFFYRPEFMPNTHVTKGAYYLQADQTEWMDIYFSSGGEEFTTIMISGDTTTCGGEFDAVQAHGYVRPRSQVMLPVIKWKLP